MFTHVFFLTGDTDAPPSTHIEQQTCCARVRYSPTLQQQNSISSKGLNADFIIQYDVDLRDLLGEVQVWSFFFISHLLSHNCFISVSKRCSLVFFTFSQVYDGYFVHYFAPRGLPVVPKDVIFVIDVSGSMIGTKIKQVKWMNLMNSIWLKL